MGNKHPILANGEYYVEPIKKKSNSGEKKLPHEYQEAKQRLLGDLKKIEDTFKSANNEVFIKQKIICVRLEPKFEAKSYAPNSLIANTDMRVIGGRKYEVERENEEEKAKLYFVKTTEKELSKFKENFIGSKKDNNKNWIKQICTIKSIDLLDSDEKVMGFSADWEQGMVEMVLHPLGNETDEVISGLQKMSGLPMDNLCIRTYDDGLTFVCANVNRKDINKLKCYNPLRSIKRLEPFEVEPLRMSAITEDAPSLPERIMRSEIKVGVFDGGVKKGIPLLDNYVKNYEEVTTTQTENSLSHGVSVCGAVLYGELSDKKTTDKVENPYVSVESFRVLPALKTGNMESDFEMYNTIDIIEKIVNERKDIKIFNLSFGPKGAIIDDNINRFTYALDRLTYLVEEGEICPLFCVAAGNDGKNISPANRIQAPSDMVNGIAVGAYTYNSFNDKSRADYSCVGPGREGAKIKPDVLEFGGSQTRPFVLIEAKGNKVGIGAGTSLASPVVAGKIGKLMAQSDNVEPHLGRTLLIHHAESKKLVGDLEIGFGYVPKDITEVLNCDDKMVTILFEGEIEASSSAKLPIFLPDISKMNCKVKLKWTICTVVNPNINDTDAYTNNCIEDTFYPNDMVFSFSKRGIKKTHKLNLLKTEDVAKANELIDLGYIRSELPATAAPNKCVSEADLRNSDLKWDTVIKKEKNMLSSSLLNPFLTLHAMGRDQFEHEKIRYYVVITIEAPRYTGSLYDNIIKNYNNLIPIKIQNINKVMVPVN